MMEKCIENLFTVTQLALPGKLTTTMPIPGLMRMLLEGGGPLAQRPDWHLEVVVEGGAAVFTLTCAGALALVGGVAYSPQGAAAAWDVLSTLSQACRRSLAARATDLQLPTNWLAKQEPIAELPWLATVPLLGMRDHEADVAWLNSLSQSLAGTLLEIYETASPVSTEVQLLVA